MTKPTIIRLPDRSDTYVSQKPWRPGRAIEIRRRALWGLTFAIIWIAIDLLLYWLWPSVFWFVQPFSVWGMGLLLAFNGACAFVLGYVEAGRH